MTNVLQFRQDLRTELTINPLMDLKAVREQIKSLTKLEDQLKKQIHSMMDEDKCDVLRLNGYVAERKLIVQKRLDTSRVREMLGDQTPELETEMIKLTVI